MKKIALIVLSITFSLIIVEILLRITGYKPWKNYETNQNIIFEPIKNLGWKSKRALIQSVLAIQIINQKFL